MTKKRNRVLIIDGDNLLHRAYHKFSGLANEDGKSTSMIYGFPYVLRSLIARFSPDILYVAFDGGRHEKRKEIHPEYKQTRHKADFDYEGFINQKKIVMDLVYAFGGIVLFKKGMEADDLIYMLIVREKLEQYYVTIVSSDKDFHQVLSNNIKIYNPFSDKIITIKNVKKLFGYEANQVVDFLTLDGDKSDNIPGYRGMGPVRIKAFFDLYPSIMVYLHGDTSDASLKKDILKPLYKKNRLLMDLRYFYLRYLRKVELPYLNGQGKKHKMLTIHIAKVCNDYDINTFLKPEFLNTYKKICS